MAVDVRYVDANGLRFAYLDEGQGPLVLLLHGFPDTAHSWDDIRPRIAARGYRVVSPWMRGYWPTQVPQHDTDLTTMGEDAIALIAALGAESAILVGHDWGASAVYTAAQLHPERVTKLVAIGIPHHAALAPWPWKLWGVRHFALYKLPGAARRFAAHDFAALPKICRRWSPEWSVTAEELAPVRESFSHPESLDAALGYYRTLTLPDAAQRRVISVPSVAFAGTSDPNITPAEYERARKYFSASYTVEAMRGGHFMHREHPDEFVAKLLLHL
jgi:pimeloyl-ACP methyl ester carboxylesterase